MTCAILALFTICAASAFAAGEKIDWQVIAGGGGDGSSASYKLSGTIGQTAVGTGSSASYNLHQGYWQDFAAGSCCVQRGDLNHNGTVNVADLTYLVNRLFKGGPPPPCLEEGNVNNDAGNTINVADLTFLVNHLFKGGPAPAPCD